MSYLRTLPMRSTQPQGRGVGTLDQVLSTIFQVEGARPQLNNPGNLTYAGQPGATPSPYSNGGGGFLAQFDTPEDGAAAAARQVQLDASRGFSILSFACKYAPSCECPNAPANCASGNNATAYAQYIADATGLSVNDALSAAIAPEPASSPDTASVSGIASLLSNFPDSSTLAWPALAAGSLLVLLWIFTNRN